MNDSRACDRPNQCIWRLPYLRLQIRTGVNCGQTPGAFFWKIYIRELEDVFVVADASFLRDSMPVTQTATAAAAEAEAATEKRLKPSAYLK